jgi:hypothetical protein
MQIKSFSIEELMSKCHLIWLTRNTKCARKCARKEFLPLKITNGKIYQLQLAASNS